MRVTLEQALEFIEDDALVEVAPATSACVKRWLKEVAASALSRAAI